MLPNPFSSNSHPKLSPSVSTGTSAALNPGPGLPQAVCTSYDSYVPKQPSKYANLSKFGGGRGGFSFGSQFLPFSCDRCDRSFRSKELLDLHIAEHIPCGIDGCTFVAHPKIVEKHIQMQHETGLAEKIMMLNTPEEIQKWKEERKRNFPSKENIARRQAEQKEKLDRGEVLYEPKKKFGRGNFQNARGRGGRGRRGVQLGNNRNPRANQSVGGDFKKTDVIPSVPKPSTLAPAPTPVGKVEGEKILSDGEIESEDETLCVKETAASTSVANALTCLIGSYASDSEEEKPVVAMDAAKPMDAADAMKPMDVKDGVNSSTSEADPNKQKTNRAHKKRPNKRKGKGGQKADGPPSKQMIGPKRLTLLQKLLQGEIIHERNVILQCVHYIVQHNFFGIGQLKAQSEASAAIESKNCRDSCEVIHPSVPLFPPQVEEGKIETSQ